MSTEGHHKEVDQGRIVGGPRWSLRCLRRGDWVQHAVRAGRWGLKRDPGATVTTRQRDKINGKAGTAGSV